MEGGSPDLPENFRNSRLSAKGFFLEGLRPSSAGGPPPRVPPDHPPSNHQRNRVLYGIRACDARAVRILEPVFAENGADGLYLGNLRRAFLVGQACTDRCRGSFCEEMGIDPQDSATATYSSERVSPERSPGSTRRRERRGSKEATFFRRHAGGMGIGPEESSGRPESPPSTWGKSRRESPAVPEEDLWRKVSAPVSTAGSARTSAHLPLFRYLRPPGGRPGRPFPLLGQLRLPGFTQMAVHNPRRKNGAGTASG